jgi:methylated-DNA-[protein]-cysteine S-methyltransferase
MPSAPSLPKCLGFALFETALGTCGIAWGTRGLVGVQLPQASAEQTCARMLQRFAGSSQLEPPAEVAAAMEGITHLLQGHGTDLRWIALDMQGLAPFYQRVYEAVRAVLPGQTITYGEVAEQLGEPSAARAVGQAMGSNPFAPVVPCHRVLAAGGKSGGFSASGGTATKLRLLLIERAQFGNQQGLF